MSSIERNTFKNYFQELSKHPDKTEKAEVLAKINETFETLASLTTSKPKHLIIKGVVIRINEMRPKELKIFAECVHKFLQNKMEIPEAQAEKMIKNLFAAEQGIVSVDTKGVFRGDTLKAQTLLALEGAKGQILLHEKIEQIEQTESNDLVVEAKKHVKELLKTEQRQALEAEQKLKAATKKANIVQAVTIGAMVVGIISFFSPLLIVSGPLSIGLFIASGILTALGYIPQGLFKFRLKEAIIEEPLHTFNKHLETLENLEKYKTTVGEPKFTEFANDLANDYKRLATDDTQFINFIHLYELQSDYEQKRRLIEQQLDQTEQRQALGEKTRTLKTTVSQMEGLNTDLERINRLRGQLGLKSLETTEL